MPKEIKKLMKKNHFTILRMKNHVVWIHISGAIVITSKSPSCKYAIKNIMKDIKKEVGICYA